MHAEREVLTNITVTMAEGEAVLLLEAIETLKSNNPHREAWMHEFTRVLREALRFPEIADVPAETPKKKLAVKRKP